MSPALILDLMLTVALSAALVAGGAVTLWLLPWTDADRALTLRAFASVARRLGEASRPRGPFRALPVRQRLRA